VEKLHKKTTAKTIDMKTINMEGKKYWITEGKNFDTHWSSQTDRVSFKSDDLWKFMEAYYKYKVDRTDFGMIVHENSSLTPVTSAKVGDAIKEQLLKL
jgi:hypothetical protein